jgi:hypothetical protein
VQVAGLWVRVCKWLVYGYVCASGWFMGTCVQVTAVWRLRKQLSLRICNVKI